MLRHITTDYAQAAYVRLFTMFAKTELEPKTYVASLIPHNLAHARKIATSRRRGWRKEVRQSLNAVVAAKQLLRLMSILAVTTLMTACDFIMGDVPTAPPTTACSLYAVKDSTPMLNSDSAVVGWVYVWHNPNPCGR